MKTDDITSLDWEKVKGLMPAIVQDADTRAVLMLGYMNEAALRRTSDTGLVTFFSRTRQVLWQKGETSGNVLELVSIKPDCDRDTLLVSARPCGPVCHKGWTTCFNEESTVGPEWLVTLEAVIGDRAGSDADESYTARLLQQGIKRIAQKVGEEGVEVALAATAGDDNEVLEESADLVYHLMVLLRARELDFSEIMVCLKQRHGSN